MRLARSLRGRELYARIGSVYLEEMASMKEETEWDQYSTQVTKWEIDQYLTSL
jgi:glutamine synthetase